MLNVTECILFSVNDQLSELNLLYSNQPVILGFFISCVAGIITSCLVTLWFINYIYIKNQRIELESALKAIYNEIKFNQNQLNQFEIESIRIKKYWGVLKNYELAKELWDKFRHEFDTIPISNIDSRVFINKSWLYPKGVSSRQIFQNSKYLVVPQIKAGVTAAIYNSNNI
jgi:hypothetical protein